MMGKRAKTNRERGISVIFTAISLTTIVPLVGLAIDAGILYTVKGRLQMAVDAGALAGARALSRGNDDASQQSNAKAVAQAYALLNFPSGYFNITPPTFPGGSITVDESVANQRSVTVSTNVTAPLYFLRWLGDTAATVNASATAVRRDVNVVIVMDRSGSLQNSGSCAGLKASAVEFVTKFANGRDNVGLVTFATSSANDFSLANNFNTASPSVSTILSSITCTGGTNSAQGLWYGYQQLVALNQPSALNVVLFFTDGYPNTFTALFPIKGSSSCTSKAAKQGVLAAGYSNPLTAPTTPSAMFGLLSWIGGTQPMASDLNETPTNSSGCAYNSDFTTVGNDIASIPNADVWGNSTNTGYQSVTTDASGNITATPMNNQNAGWNAADNAAFRIRNSAAIPNIHTYAIGLGNAGGTPADFLERSANDPRASNYDSTKPAGIYVFAPTSADLSNAFAEVASQILHLSK
jgi:Flp pilus assembly protein TadG